MTYLGEGIRPHVFTEEQDRKIIEIMSNNNKPGWKKVGIIMQKFGYKLSGIQCKCRWYTKLKPGIDKDMNNQSKTEFDKLLTILQDQGPEKICQKMKKTSEQIKTLISNYLKKSLQLFQEKVKERLDFNYISVENRQYRCMLNMMVSKLYKNTYQSDEFSIKILQMLKLINNDASDEELEQQYLTFSSLRKNYLAKAYQESVFLNSKKIKKQKQNQEQEFSLQVKVFQLFVKYGKRYKIIASNLEKSTETIKIFQKYQQLSEQSQQKRTQEGRVRQLLIVMIRDGLIVLYQHAVKCKHPFTKILKKIAIRRAARLLLGMNNLQSIPIKQQLIRLRLTNHINEKQLKAIVNFLLNQKDQLLKQRNKHSENDFSEDSSNVKKDLKIS